ncbi:DNA polymerase [Synechococcus phage B3]|nr:DNA polymerase [Synechococcus phage B3]QGT54915.1 DNA polymerase [Synechococcus phage B23]
MFYTSVKQIGNFIYERGYDDLGVPFAERVEYKPTFYITTNKKSDWVTLDNKSVTPIKPGTIKECRNWLEQYKDVDGVSIYGHETAMYQYISGKYPEEIESFDISKIKLYTLDIETTAEHGGINVDACLEEILLITIQNYTDKKTYTWGSRPFGLTVENNVYCECSNEVELLEKFLTFWEQNYPDVLTGWNITFFDCPYLVNRITKVLGEREAKRLSIWKYIKQKVVEINNREQTTYELVGIASLDLLDLYKKYSFKKPENHMLDTIAYNELGDRKLEQEYETFKDRYTKDWDNFVRYNIQDCSLVDRLEQKLQLINMSIDLAYQSKSNYDDVFYQVRMWDNIIYNYLKKKNIVIPLKTRKNKTDKFAGAYVKEPIPGKYGWTVSMDLSSLYPHIMISSNISPETLVPDVFPDISVDKLLQKKVDTSIYPDYCICPNGAMFRRDQLGFFPSILSEMFMKRQFYKDKMIEAEKQYEKTKNKDLLFDIANYQVKQLSLKVCLNSGYGASGNQYFRFYELRNAEAVTLSGQLAIRWIENKLNYYFNKLLKTENVDYVICEDTDSCFLNVQTLVDKIFENKDPDKEQIVNLLDNIFSTTIKDYIDNSYSELSDYLNFYVNKLHMKREKIADQFLITGKKHYIINVWDNEGVRYSEPKISITGLEAVKSSTPAYCRQKFKEAFNVLMNSGQDEMIDFIARTREEFKSLTPEQISSPRSVNNLTKYKNGSTLYSKGAPLAVRGSILYNHHIKRNNLQDKYTLINNGDKIKYCYLKLPNPIMENVISYIQKFPVELNLLKYVDYDLQFEKTFVQPLKSILDIINWEVEKTATLEDFFI